jgi:hypothetical protein
MRRFVVQRLLGQERFDRFKEFQLHSRAHPRIAIAFARAAATSALRQIDPTRPVTWEFSAFSQNGEDGIIDYLCGQLLQPARYFVEIGAANGLENNTTWLAMGRRYGGLMIDGDPAKVAQAEQTFKRLNWALEFAARLVNRDNASEIRRLSLVPDPDVFSLDVDSIDYYIAEALLEQGFRPKIFIVEYNSVFGPGRSVTVPYDTAFNRHRAHKSGYYYGVSVMGLRNLFDRFGYRFVTVDQNGLNAFFADPSAFDARFLDAVRGTEYRENIVHRRESRSGWEAQFEQIRQLPLIEIAPHRRRAAPELASAAAG